mmetsp:Transcript_1386/g.4279  ORF Transcript_1386/g.4279 Transcript_1386/m.4279 type:complete len:221 (-) Transcript_1386:867-1529(-)
MTFPGLLAITLSGNRHVPISESELRGTPANLRNARNSTCGVRQSASSTSPSIASHSTSSWSGKVDASMSGAFADSWNTWPLSISRSASDVNCCSRVRGALSSPASSTLRRAPSAPRRRALGEPHGRRGGSTLPPFALRRAGGGTISFRLRSDKVNSSLDCGSYATRPSRSQSSTMWCTNKIKYLLSTLHTLVSTRLRLTTLCGVKAHRNVELKEGLNPPS